MGVHAMGGKIALGDSPDREESGNVLFFSVACRGRELEGMGCTTCQESFAAEKLTD